MKIFNIIGWMVVATLCLAAPLVNTLAMYSVAVIGLMLMYVISTATVYDDIDKEIIEELKK